MRKSKRKSPSSSALVVPPEGATSLVPPPKVPAVHEQKKRKKEKNVSGMDIMKGYIHLMEGYPKVKGMWSAEELCVAIPKVYSLLKGKESLLR